MKLQIILGSVREARETAKIGHWFAGLAQKHGSFDEVEVIDLEEWDLPMKMEPETADSRKKTEDYRYEYSRKWSAKISEGDAYAFITPEYNHGYSAPLKNAIDHLYYEWAHKPAVMLSMGGAGGARGMEALINVLIAVQIVPLAYNVRLTYDEVTKDGVKSESGDKKAEGLLEPLAAYAKALKPVRAELLK